MTEPETKATKATASRRISLIVGTAFVIGGLAGAAVAVGLHGGGSTAASTASTEAQTTTTDQSTTVSQATSQFDAETIYKRDSPGVVDITVTTSSGSGAITPFGPSGSQQSQAEGTGFVYDKNGDIVTAQHVVSGATRISVRFPDGTTAKATLVGSDASTDTAVIKVSVPAGKLTPLTLGNSSNVAPGEGVVAIGSPFGYEGSITAGIVSAVGRNINAPNGYAIPNVIQTDAPINHGNSGGPLIDSAGQVVGVNVQIADDGQGGSDNAGVGFAVPSNAVKTVVDDLIAGRTVKHPYLGVSVGTPAAGAGARIGTVRAGSPAESAGLKSGDVIVGVDGVTITDPDQLTGLVSEHQPGDKLTLTVKRDGTTKTIEVTLGTRPATAT
jgi:putative serine protease PepD